MSSLLNIVTRISGASGGDDINKTERIDNLGNGIFLIYLFVFDRKGAKHRIHLFEFISPHYQSVWPRTEQDLPSPSSIYPSTDCEE